jgi:hypothetical protein
MTTSGQGPRRGPPDPSQDPAGRFAWSVYRPGYTVHCPGTRPDRRGEFRGDRRQEPRPCRMTWGRAGDQTEVHIRVRSGREMPVGQVVSCPECSMSIQIKQVPVAEAA